MLCLSQSEYDGHFYICNPVLGEYTTLPPVLGITQYYAPFGFGFRFGYDPSNDEYKVVRLWCCMDMGNKFFLVGEIYTLGCDRVSLRGGRALGMCHIQLRQIILQFFLNGVLHWMTNPAIALESTETIVCFHVGSEQFQVLPENNIDISKF